MKITEKQYSTALYEAVKDKKKGEVKSLIKDFAKLIIQNNDTSKLDKIINEYEKVWNRDQGIVNAEVISAKALDKPTIKYLNDYIKKTTKAKKIELNKEIDDNLLGGVVVKYGDKVLDGSLKTKLNELKSSMTK